MVVLGWATPGLDDNMTLDFRPYETAITMLSVLIVAFQVQVGEVTYLSGVILVVAYCIISVSYIFLNRKQDNVVDPMPGVDPADAGRRFLRGAAA